MSNDPFDIPLAELRQRRSAKWSRIPDGALPLWVAEMDVRLAEPITERLRAALDISDTGYAPSTDVLAAEFAGFAARRWDWAVDPARCIGYPDLGASGVAVLRHFAGPDRRVIITPPVYNSFYTWLRDGGLTPYEAALRMDAFGEPDLDAIERGFADGVRVVLISNPHNPLGRLWTRAELTDLAALALRYDAIVVSDEIHAPLTYPGNEFVPFLTVSDAARSQGLALHSASKAWNLAGLKASLVVTGQAGPQFPVAEETAWAMGLFGVLAAESAFRDGEPWLDDVAARLAYRATYVQRRLASELPGARVVIPEASYLMWLDLREAMPGEDNPAATILQRTGLMLSPGPIFGEIGWGCARLNIATSMGLLDDALDRIVHAAHE